MWQEVASPRPFPPRIWTLIEYKVQWPGRVHILKCISIDSSALPGLTNASNAQTDHV